MVVIDLAVIAYILLGKGRESAVYAVILFFLNLIFFDLLTDVYQIYIGIKNGLKFSEYKAYINKALAFIFFSGIIQYTPFFDPIL